MDFRVVATISQTPSGEWTYPDWQVVIPATELGYEEVTELFGQLAVQLLQLSARRMRSLPPARRARLLERSRTSPRPADALPWVQLTLVGSD